MEATHLRDVYPENIKIIIFAVMFISVVWYNEDGSMAGQSRHIPSAITTSKPSGALNLAWGARQPAAQAVIATDNEDVRMHLGTLNGMGT